MLNQLLKFTLVSGALLWLKPRWRGLLALVCFVLLVHVLHGEYLGYVELSDNDEFLLWSYVVKWLALIAGVLAYFFFAIPRGENSGKSKKAATAVAGSPGAEASALEAPQDDGFEFLRAKKQLESRAEKLLNHDSSS